MFGSFVRTGEKRLWMPFFGEQRSAEIIASDTEIDLHGCELTTIIGLPDRCKETAVTIERRNGVELRNARISGFKVGIYARNCENLVLDSLTFSDMFRQRLHSTPDREDTRDWLWPHNNDNREWMTNYGACIVLENCKNCVIRNCSARGTQNGIILDKCEGCQVYNNDFSYCSGWGCALWRSCKNTVAQNRFDYCVRGYSHGVYARGQDSAGILVFEQCCDNTFAYNSATHSGDGFFLYAGHETTQRTGKGGCNRNLVYGNDFSYAVANGIEATFSDGNVFAKNKLVGCDYGIWGGYSYNTVISQNEIADSLTAGIAIEHGHDNWIEGNTFSRNRTGIWLWCDEDKELTGGVYGRLQNTKSERNSILRNSFYLDSTNVTLDTTDFTVIENNDFAAETAIVCKGEFTGTLFQHNNFGYAKILAQNLSDKGSVLTIGPSWIKPGLEDVVVGAVVLDAKWAEERFDSIGSKYERAVSAPRNVGPDFITHGSAAPAERNSIIVGPWGAIEFADYPVLLQFESDFSGKAVVWILAALEKFEFRQVENSQGIPTNELSVNFERFSNSVMRCEIVPKFRGLREFAFEIEGRTDSGMGAARPWHAQVAGRLLAWSWSLRFWQWTPRDSSIGPPDWASMVESEPIMAFSADDLEYKWEYQPPYVDGPADHFATVATTEIELPAGLWKLVLTSDDGARLFVDGAKVIERWDIHGPTDDEFTLTLEKPRRVKLRVEHFENTGWAALALRIERP